MSSSAQAATTMVRLRAYPLRSEPCSPIGVANQGGPAGSAYEPVSTVYDGGIAMKTSKCMTRDVQLVSPTQTIRDAAHMMAEFDAGALPVQENDRLVGMITHRD